MKIKKLRYAKRLHIYKALSVTILHQHTPGCLFLYVRAYIKRSRYGPVLQAIELAGIVTDNNPECGPVSQPCQIVD